MGVMSRTMVGDTLRDTPVTVSRVSRTMVGDTPSHISLAVLARVKLKIFFQIVPSSAGLSSSCIPGVGGCQTLIPTKKVVCPSLQFG